MAGLPKTRERLDALAKENAELRRQISQFEAAGVRKRSSRAPRKIEEGIDVLCDEMLNLADDGLTTDEIAARWNVSAETLEEWANTHAPFAADLDRARTRARAVTLGVIRTSLQNGRGLPAGMLDRVLALHSTKSKRDDDAEGLIHVHLTYTEPASGQCPCCTGACRTLAVADAEQPRPVPAG